MDSKKIKPKTGPEAIIQERVRRKLLIESWYVIKCHGNMYQQGLPDLFATHSMYGHRWIEVKNPLAYSFTPAQMDTFPKLVANGSPVWIMVDDTEEEYQKLFKPCNWWQYLSVLK